MSDKVNVNVNGPSISLVSLLTVLFVGLKLTGYITWSWIWVLSPLWISFGLFICLLIFLLVIAFIASR